MSMSVVDRFLAVLHSSCVCTIQYFRHGIMNNLATVCEQSLNVANAECFCYITDKRPRGGLCDGGVV